MFNNAEGAAKLLGNYDLLTKEVIPALRGTDDVYGWRSGEANLSKRCRSAAVGATEVAIAVDALDRMNELGRAKFVQVA
jgi:hypothetical protein